MNYSKWMWSAFAGWVLTAILYGVYFDKYVTAHEANTLLRQENDSLKAHSIPIDVDSVWMSFSARCGNEVSFTNYRLLLGYRSDSGFVRVTPFPPKEIARLDFDARGAGGNPKDRVRVGDRRLYFYSEPGLGFDDRYERFLEVKVKKIVGDKSLIATGLGSQQMWVWTQNLQEKMPDTPKTGLCRQILFNRVMRGTGWPVTPDCEGILERCESPFKEKNGNSSQK